MAAPHGPRHVLTCPFLEEGHNLPYEYTPLAEEGKKCMYGSIFNMDRKGYS